MKSFLLTYFIFASISSFANVFNEDNREEFHSLSSELKKLAQSSVAIISKNKLVKQGDYYYPKVKSIQKTFNFCEDSSFKDQPQLANCSGSLIASNIILTAGHCFSKEIKGRGIEDYYIVFGYQLQSPDQTEFRFSTHEVFEIKEELYHNFDRTMFTTMIDLALYSLKRVPPFNPAKINFNKPFVGENVFILGYPLGIPMKHAAASAITKNLPGKHSFRHELDTFSVNSGSPIFNVSHEVIGVHVRGTGINFKQYDGRDCYDWGRGISGVDYGEANDLTPLVKLLKEQISTVGASD